MKTYYATQTVIRYYGPSKQKRWREPPHLHFANLELDWKSLLAFDSSYGPLLREHVQMKPEMRGILDKAPNLTKEEREAWKVVASRDRFEISVSDGDVQFAKRMQDLLRQAWSGAPLAIETLQHGISHHAQQEAYGPLEVKVAGGAAGVELYTRDLWGFIRVAFLADYAAGRTRTCASQDCPTPYFLQARKGQTFCCHKCAVLINVRRFREGQREAQEKSRARKSKRRTKR